MKLTNEQINKAVAWWGDRLTNRKFQTLRPEERGLRENRPAALAEVMAATIAPPVSEDQILSFSGALKRRLEEADNRCSLAVDYEPDPMLAKALDEARIPASHALPWKTVMWFRDGKVEVRYGYGAEIQEL